MNEAFSYSRAQIRAPNYGIWCCCLSPPGESNQVSEDNCRIVLTEKGLCRPKSHQQHASLTTKMPNGFCGAPRTYIHSKTFFGGGLPALSFVFLCGAGFQRRVYTMKCQIRPSSVKYPLLLLHLWHSGLFRVTVSTLSCIQRLGNTKHS